MGKQPTNKNKGNVVGLFLMVLAAVITIIIAGLQHLVIYKSPPKPYK